MDIESKPYTPLLHHDPDFMDEKYYNTYQKLSFTKEAVKLCANTFPISLSFCLQTIVQTTGILAVSQLGGFDQAVASYAFMFIDATGAIVAFGGSSALDTLCSQAFTTSAAPDRTLMILLQQGCILLSLLFIIFVAPLWWYSGALFEALGQEKAFAEATGYFVRVSIPSCLLQIWGECLKRALQAQGRSAHVTCSIGAASVIGILMNHVLVDMYGILGVPLAITLYYLCIFIFLGALVWSSSWMGFTRDIFQDCRIHIWHALIGIFTAGSEIWSFQIIAMMAATLDKTSVEAHGVLIVCESLFTTISMGHNIATSMRTGNLLGLGNSENTRFFANYVSYVTGFLIASISCITIIIFREVPGHFLSSSIPAAKMAATILPMMGVWQLFDVANGSASGILRGAGKNHHAGMSNVAAYYTVGLGLAWFLGFHMRWGLIGLWVGIICGCVALLGLQAVLAYRIDWEKETETVLTYQRVSED